MKWYMLVIDWAVASWRTVNGKSLRPRLVKAVLICSLFINAGSVQAQQATVVAEDTAYIRVVQERAGKIVATLSIADTKKYQQVQNIVAMQYRNLNQVHEGSKLAVAALKQNASLSKEALAEAVKKEEEAKEAKLGTQHTTYINQLKKELNEEQVEKVKNGMTYGVLPLTYAAFQDMIPTLTEPQKKQIYDWLLEARDHAMDAESSDKKHWWFGKYKGRINNYLSAQGYDLKKANEDWARRRNAVKNASN